MMWCHAFSHHKLNRIAWLFQITVLSSEELLMAQLNLIHNGWTLHSHWTESWMLDFSIDIMIFILCKLYILSGNPKHSPHRKPCAFLHYQKNDLWAVFLMWTKKRHFVRVMLDLPWPHTHTHAQIHAYTHTLLMGIRYLLVLVRLTVLTVINDFIPIII